MKGLLVVLLGLGLLVVLGPLGGSVTKGILFLDWPLSFLLGCSLGDFVVLVVVAVVVVEVVVLGGLVTMGTLLFGNLVVVCLL